MVILPNNRRKAIVVTIFKSNKNNKHKPESYRTNATALTNAMCELLEKIINERVGWFLRIDYRLAQKQRELELEQPL